MRLSTDYYPDYIDYTCTQCWADNTTVKVDSIEDDFVCVYCPECEELQYERVIED